MITKSTLVECMSIVEDPRIERCRHHDIVDILVLAVMCGADRWEDIELFARTGLG
ncbi:MAG: transposase family protein [Pirellulaceae bacterium]|nr:transposase family protein [Pirellulaceae bacterium]